jgi:glycosyltransferase involved in cell wall biosynthesis
MQATKYAVVIPVYKAGKTLPELIQNTVTAMNLLAKPYEIIMVDDGSPDDSWQVMKGLKEKYPLVKIMKLSENFGQLAATTCGIDNASSDTIITMDDDMQFSPNELPALVNFFETNQYKLVFGVPAEKMDSRFHHLNRTFAQLLFRNLFLYRYRNIEYFSSLRILSAENLGPNKLTNIFMMWKLPPESIGNFAVKHYPTLKDITSYTYWKRVKHFKPYILLALQKTAGFLGFLSILGLALYYSVFAGQILIYRVGIYGLSVSLLILFVSSLALKRDEKINYQIEVML